MQGWSERRIARELGFARETVRKYLRQDPSAAPAYQLHNPRPKPVLEPYLPIWEWWLEEDEQQPVKQRRTARRMFLDLREQYDYPGGESTIRRAVRELKAKKKEVFIPLFFKPGQRAELTLTSSFQFSDVRDWRYGSSLLQANPGKVPLLDASTSLYGCWESIPAVPFHRTTQEPPSLCRNA